MQILSLLLTAALSAVSASPAAPASSSSTTVSGVLVIPYNGGVCPEIIVDGDLTCPEVPATTVCCDAPQDVRSYDNISSCVPKTGPSCRRTSRNHPYEADICTPPDGETAMVPVGNMPPCEDGEAEIKNLFGVTIACLPVATPGGDGDGDGDGGGGCPGD